MKKFEIVFPNNHADALRSALKKTKSVRLIKTVTLGSNGAITFVIEYKSEMGVLDLGFNTAKEMMNNNSLKKNP